MLTASWFLFLFIVLMRCLSAQDLPQRYVRFSHPTLERINGLVNASQYKKAIDLSVQGAYQMHKESNTEGYINFMLRAAEIETFEVWKGKGSSDVVLYPDYGRARNYLDLLNREAGQHFDDYPQLKANILFTNAVVYYWLNMPDTAELLHIEALSLRKALYGSSSREVADSHLWLGVLYNWGLQRKDVAEQHYQIARELQGKYMPDSRYALGSAYYGLAAIARRRYRFDETLMLTNEYLSLYNDMPYEQAFGFQLIANVYWDQGDFEKSLRYREKSIRIYQESDFDADLIIEYSNLANDLVNMGRHHEAEMAMKNAEQILDRSTAQYPYYAKMLFSSFGDLYSLMGRYDAARSNFAEALDIAIKQYGERNDEVAEVYRMRGHMFMKQSLFEEALTDFQKMLVAVVPGFSSGNYNDNPEIQVESPYFKTIIASAFYKGDAFLKWFQTDGNGQHLESAIENYRFAYHQLFVARHSIGDELSRIFLMSNFEESIEGSILCGSLLYRRTADPEFVHDLFYFVEVTKYLTVLDALHRSARANNSQVPVDLLFRLERTREELSGLQREQMQSNEIRPLGDAGGNGDSIMALIQTRSELMTEIARYTGEALFHPDSLIMGLTEVQTELDADQQILEFFWGKDRVYSISITNNACDVRVVHRAELDTLLGSIHRMLEGQRSYGPAQAKDYSRWTSDLYKKLFEPSITRDRLIIIPDGLLNLIPVEALVVRFDPTAVSFRDLDYLIYDREISYAYSTGILFFNRKEVKPPLNNILVFSYPLTPSSSTVGSAALPGTLRESAAIARQFKNVNTFSGKDALKTNFVKNVANHDLIHLGVHGIGDPEVAENSRLLFTGDSLGNTELYAYEINNIDIDARLVVLSACETGVGKRLTGEGIFSIARAFIYAGCPSVVMSMWKVHDRFSASIMEDFYGGLSDGHSFSTSLREAKIKFLNHADDFSAHPANWSAFVFNGQDQSFDRKTLPVVMVSLLLFLIIASGYVAIRKWRRFNR